MAGRSADGGRRVARGRGMYIGIIRGRGVCDSENVFFCHVFPGAVPGRRVAEQGNADFSGKNLAVPRRRFIFAPDLKPQAFETYTRKGARVVEEARLESV